MIKVVSADIWRIEHGRRAKNGGLCNGPKRRFRAYPLLDNASCLPSVVIGGRGVGVRCTVGSLHVSQRFAGRVADSAVETW
jgi:hypothetical protein